MDYKVKVAQVIEQAVDGKLSQEDILAKIEKPKTLNLGDYAFPAFVLSFVFVFPLPIIFKDMHSTKSNSKIFFFIIL